MTNVQNSNKKYDLVERTFIFSKELMMFVGKIKPNQVTRPIVNQLIRSGTSVGANFCEADEASSQKDFINKVAIANKEAKETQYWLKLLLFVLPQNKKPITNLLSEVKELNLILSSIIRKSRNSLN
jgi:four helix bundle protein